MEASKWLDIQLLVSPEEMEGLIQQLGKFQIFLTGSVTPRAQGEVTKQHFLDIYRRYCTALQKGQLPDTPLFSCVWTVSPDVVATQKIGEERQLLRLIKPAVQLQPHSMIYSEHDGKFYSMVYGRNSISWGLQFSYPQLYLDPETKEVIKVGANFPNSALFRQIQLWVRAHTLPTPIKTPTASLNLPIRLGKECFSWVNQHPHLKAQHLLVSR